MDWIIIWIFLAVVLFITWTFTIKWKRAGIVDTVWSFSLGLTAPLWVILNYNEGNGTRNMLLIAITTIWSLRLGLHLYSRIKREKEDARYATLIKKWGSSWKIKMLGFFQIQAIASLILSSTFWTVSSNSTDIHIFDYIACLIAIIAILGESLADKQLEHYRSKESGTKGVCKTGLWKYSRHPNYFFEWLFWVSFIFLSLGHMHFYISFIAPIAIYYFLTKASGIPHAERQSLAKRGMEYRKYQQETSAFFPWFPRKKSNINLTL